jgi:hypothetical protein
MKESSLRLYASSAPPKSDGGLRDRLSRPSNPDPARSLSKLTPPKSDGSLRDRLSRPSAEPSVSLSLVDDAGDASQETAYKPPPIQTISFEQAIIEALDAPANPDERASDAFRRKEYAIGQLFGALSIVEAHILHRRLSLRDAADPIATRFARLIVERQARLMSFLGDARRRAALAKGR